MTARSKALAITREGRLRVLEVCWPTGHPRALYVRAEVVGRRGRHQVVLDRERWTCTCPDPPPCTHAIAAALVTGWPSLQADPLRYTDSPRSTPR